VEKKRREKEWFFALLILSTLEERKMSEYLVK
jgi:hypothetical protein